MELFAGLGGRPYLLSLVWGCLEIASGIGLLLQKIWGYRLTQAIMIINIIFMPFFLFIPDYIFITKLITVIIGISLSGLILWYLSIKDIKEQFLENKF